LSGADVATMTLLTVRVGLVSTVASAPLAIGLGYALARREFRGRALVQAAVALPMVLPPVAVGLGLLLLLSRDGVLGSLLARGGIAVPFTWWAAALAAAVVGFPLFVRACEQAFAETDRRYDALSRTLGLPAASTFLRVTLPLARRGVLYGALLAFTRGLGEFGATAIVAGILPGRTETLALGIWSRVQAGDDRAALVLCAVSFALALVSLVAAEGWLRRRGRPPEDS
jgi:molybdate transport system permease protein